MWIGLRAFQVDNGAEEHECGGEKQRQAQMRSLSELHTAGRVPVVRPWAVAIA